MSNQVALFSYGDLKAQKVAAEERLDELRPKQVPALEEERDFEHNGEILLVSERIDTLKKGLEREGESHHCRNRWRTSSRYRSLWRYSARGNR